MKKVIFIISLCLFSLNFIAQKSVNKDPDWKVGETKTFKGNNVKRIEGENKSQTITNITYQTQKQLIEEVNKGSSRGDAKKKQIKKYKDYAAGGKVVFFINRATLDRANLQNITITINDNAGKEIYKRTYKAKSAKADNKYGGFSISSNLQIKSKVGKPFTVELFDGKTLYKFEVF